MGRFRAGFSEVVITPPLGVRLSGYSARTGASTGVLDDLYAKALVVEASGRRLALVACDLLQLDRSIVSAVRQRVARDVGIAAEALLVSAIHTHSGPDLDRLEECMLDHLVAQIAGAVYGASIALEDVEIGFGEGACSVGANRRFRGSPTAPHFLYNDPEGLIDPTVMVMTVRAASGEMRGAVVNYACHAVTLGDDELRISKDYVHFTCETLKQAWGSGAAAIFLQGCEGNINPRWIWDRPDLTPPPERTFPAELAPRLRETARLGRVLGAEALKTAESILAPSSEAGLGLGVRTVELPVRRDLSREMRQAIERAGRTERKYRTIHHALAAGASTYAAEVQVLRVGDALIVGLPGEIFVEYQIEIRKRLAPRPVFVAALANDNIDYICTTQAFTEGGYEPMVSYFAPEAGDLLVEGAVAAAKVALG